MNLSYYASYGDSQDPPISDLAGDFSSLSFSKCGQLMAAGTDKGKVYIFPISNQNQIVSKTLLLPSISFNVPQSKFNSNRGVFMPDSISSIQFLPEYQLNPKLLVSSSYSTHLYQVTHEDFIKWTMNKNANFQNFEIPQKQSSTIQYKSEYLQVFDDIRLNRIVKSEFYCPSTIFVSSTNATCLFDLNKKTSSTEVTILSIIPDSESSTMNSEKPNITCSDLNKQFYELFLLGLNDGTVSLFDMRQQPENLTPSFKLNAQQFVQKEHKDNFIDIKSIQFAPNNTFFAARTFGDLLIFDMRKPNETYAQLDVQWFNRINSIALTGMNNDKFGLDFIDDIHLILGAYDETMIIWDFENQSTNKIELQNQNKSKEFNRFLNQVRCIKVNSSFDLIAATSNESVYFYTLD